MGTRIDREILKPKKKKSKEQSKRAERGEEEVGIKRKKQIRVAKMSDRQEIK